MRTREVKHQVRIAAKMFAFLRYQKRNPEARSDLAHAFAERAWPGFVDMALDFMAIREALRQQDAAPFN
jgi:hypothetical protein